MKKETSPRTAHRILSWIAARILPVERVGLDNLPSSPQGTVLVANHISLLDGFLVCLFVHRPMLFCITGDFALKQPGEALFHWLGWVTGGSHITLDPERPFGMRKILEALKDGQTVVLFPEGKISDTGDLQPLQPGLMRIVERSGALTVPVRIDGAATSVFGRAPAPRRTLRPRISMIARGQIPANHPTFHEALRRALGAGEP